MRLVSSIALALALLAPASLARAAPAELRKDWPCVGCFTALPATGASPAPRPLLVALHGDFNGDSSAPTRLFRALRPACEQAEVILVALRCPEEKGCRTGSFWQWRSTEGHDPGWLGAQIDAVASSVGVDAARVYAAGYSGGATYLGWYGPTYAERFAAIVHIAGGVPWGDPCPRCKVPVLFTLGAGDPMLVPYTRPLRDYYEACGGHEVVWETLPGVSHEGILGVVQGGKGSALLAWLLGHRAACAGEIAAIDAGSIAVPIDAGAITQEAAVKEAGTAGPAPSSMVAPGPSAVRMSPGCACALRGGEGAREAEMTALMTMMIALARRRARRDHSL